MARVAAQVVGAGEKVAAPERDNVAPSSGRGVRVETPRVQFHRVAVEGDIFADSRMEHIAEHATQLRERLSE